MLLDADIELDPGLIVSLRKKMQKDNIQFISLMVRLRMNSFWERLLMPAFVYFFKLLYPFRVSNSKSRFVAAAAGGCILMETKVLSEIGGFQAIKQALIDDCALAREVKSKGFRTWIGLTRSAHSFRAYSSLSTIWKMVERTAFTQLHYSWTLLLFLTALMLTAFCAPVIYVAFWPLSEAYPGLLALGAMVVSYIPTLRFYKIPKWWAITLPFTGFLYLCMTWSSAIMYARGERSYWKGRSYRKL